MPNASQIPSMSHNLQFPSVSAVGASKARIAWVDAARGIGIIAVFFGHYLQDIATRNPVAMVELRFLYSFHVPFFFVLAGLFSHREHNFLAQVRVLALRRLLPVLFFGVCFAGIDIAEGLRTGKFDSAGFTEAATGYLIGRPLLDWVTWFLVCLFVAEIFAYLVLPRLREATSQITIGILSILAGAAFGNHSGRMTDGIAYYVGEFWFFSEAMVALGFYLVGHALRPWLESHLDSRRGAILVAGAGLLIVLLTFQRNTVDGRPFLVMLAARSHGNVAWFCITALAGSLSLMALGSLLSRVNLLSLTGRNTIPLLGLNGLFFHHLNQTIAGHLPPPASHAGVLLTGVLVTGASLLLCLPVVAILQALIPQLVGSPRRIGPLLPALE